MGALVSKPLGLTATHERAAVAPIAVPSERASERAIGLTAANYLIPLIHSRPYLSRYGDAAPGYKHPFSVSLGPSQVTHTHMPHFPDK